MPELPSQPDRRSQAAAALESVGTHRSVRLEVTDVTIAGGSVAIDLVIHYPVATPVCCGQPGCYLPFLGIARTRVPAAVGLAFAVSDPAVTVRAELRHEPGYRYIDHATGRLTDPGVDHVQTYEPEHFDATSEPANPRASAGSSAR